MSGIRKCKEFLRSLNQEELRNIRVKIKRHNIPEPEIDLPCIFRGLDDPKSLVIHFRKEALRGIFDREDIVVNQEFPEETKKKSRSCDRRSSSTEDCRVKSRNVSYYNEASSSHANERGRSHRSRSRSRDRTRKRSRSGSYRRRSRSSSRRKEYNRRSYSADRKRSRSSSPRPKKKPGLFIPTASDYLKHEKRRANRSRSPVHGRKNVEHSRKSSGERHRKSRTPSRSRRSRSSSRDRRSSRSRSHHYEREIEHVGPYGNPRMVPCIFQDGAWIPMGPAFIPRGYFPPPMYPRPFPPPMMMPRMPNIMPPYRLRAQRPRLQIQSGDSASTSSNTVQNKEEASNETCDEKDN